MGYQHYADTDIQTSDPRAVIVLLYEGAIKFLNRSLDACERNDRWAVSDGVVKAQKIIHFLSSSLDFEDGGEVAENLDRLYAYMRDTLNDANLHCRVEKIQEVIDLFKPLLSAWRDVAQDPTAAEALEKRRVQNATSAVAKAQPAGAITQPVASMSGGALTYGVSSEPVRDKRDDVDMSQAASAESGSAVVAEEKVPVNVAAGRQAYGLRSTG